ncbi:MAG: Smr/MutS family protein, partial [Chloroflexota bacterium]
VGQASGEGHLGAGRGVSISAPVVDNPSRELDIRGVRAHEAHDRVTAFLDQAALLGLGSVRIIHGRGTGALREATRDALRRHPAAEGFHNADPQEGGDGATEVTLA